MSNWRDTLRSDVEYDDANGLLKSDGQFLTTAAGFTDYGRRWFQAELIKLNRAVEEAEKEIAFAETHLQPKDGETSEDREINRQLYAKVKRDYALLLDVKSGTEKYFAKWAAIEDA